MSKPTTFPELLSHWRNTELSEALGVPYINARKMRERESVNPVHWPALIDAASAKGIELEYSDLVAMKQAKRAAA